MSSQAERIRAFKLAQHARLQKQDEEEQWISSEELCTEGSSDEETHTASVKTSHRKPKRNQKIEKRGISPLAQPPKMTETESTSTYQRDAQYLSPETQLEISSEERSTSNIDQMVTEKSDTKMGAIEDKVGHLDLGASSSEAHSSKYDSKEDSIESDVDQEIEKMIQWRPKRGSIKLPEFPEGRPSTLQHTIFEENAFHTEMITQITFLKRQPLKRKFTLPAIANTFITDNLNTVQEKKQEESPDENFWKQIIKLDNLISEKDSLYQTVKEERKLVQDEMCTAIKEVEITPTHSKKSQVFLQLCHFEDNCDEEDEKEGKNVNDKSSNQPSKKQRKSGKCDKDFVTRNIELAKRRSMAQFSLTDEEKIKLEDLLADIDSEEYSHDVPKTKDKGNLKNFNADEDPEANVNYFKLKEDDLTNLKDLETKLNDILDSYDETDRETKMRQVLTNGVDEDILETADKEGRYWKHHLMQQRLENIDKDLADIAAKYEEEKKKLESQNELAEEDNNEEVED